MALTINLYYNNAQEDGDWGNLLNWWQDSGFTIQATALPTSTNPINLYGAFPTYPTYMTFKQNGTPVYYLALTYDVNGALTRVQQD